jgi:DNA-binding FadR family transcriptional regulator
VRDRNAQAAVKAVREHLIASKERVIREVEQLQQDSQAAQ